MALKQPRIVRFVVVAGMSVLLLAACAHPQQARPGSSPPSSGITGSQDPSTTGSPGSEIPSPPIEATTGLESPQSPGSGGGGNAVAISVAPLPAGGSASGNNNECMQITWAGSPIPHGDVVTVSVAVQPPFTFDQEVTAHCEGGPSCASYQFSAVNDNGSVCNVGLGYTGGTIDANGSSSVDGSMTLTGQLKCPDVDSATCHRDARAMQNSGVASPLTFNVNVTSPSSPSSGASSSDNAGLSSSAPDGGSSGPGTSGPTAPSSS